MTEGSCMDHKSFPGKMEKGRIYMVERIFNITLEIICLLTGEDCRVVNMCGEPVTISSKSPLTRGWNRIQKSIMMLDVGNNDQKILDLTYKIIELLSGEVPIRCQDVTIYFSLEEWDYIEGHKDQYQDIMMEHCHFLTSQDLSEDRSKEKLASPRNLNLTTSNVYETSQYPSTQIQDPKTFLDDTGNLSDDNIYIQHPTIHIKEESASGDDGDAKDIDIYADNIQLYPSIYVKEESTSCEEGNVTDNDIYTEQTHYSSNDQAADTLDGEYRSYYHNSLDLHKTDATQEEPSSIICSECGESFSTDSMLVLHQRIHGRRQIHSCPECGMCFTSSTYLSRHVRSHTIEKPFACSECGKRFASNEDCAKHETAHTVRRPYICNVCGKYFSNNSNRVRHQKIHTDEKPFSCNECGKSFRRKTHLTIHRRVHTGEKPFHCPQCGKCFSCSAHLAAHRRIHRREAVFLG